MGGVYDEFQRELQGIRRKNAGRPRQEMVHLFLLALEREELVSVAYREALIVRRLRRMPIEQPVRELIRHALIWVWKDEEMHAIYIRGAILRLGPFPLRARALLRQVSGAVAGWASSVRQHVRWRELPFSRALATAFTWVGLLLGQVPSDVRQHLRYGPFRNFCRFNEEAERTAWLCYSRLLAVFRELPEVPPALIDDFRRVQADEERHRRIFEVLAEALDEQDRLVASETAASLAQKIAVVGDVFLPPAHRGSNAENPIASGGPVWVLRGANSNEKLPLFRRLLAEAGLADRVADCSQVLNKPPGKLRVVVKAAFMLGYHRKDLAPITDPALLDELARYLWELGCRDVALVEARNLYDRFYENRTVPAVAAYLGLDSPHYRVVDLSGEQVPHAYGRGMAQYSVGQTWREADFRISFGKLRSHPVDLLYLCVGNVEGVGARCDEFLFAERQAHRHTAIMMALDEFPPHFALLDAYDQAADGLVGMMGCPRPPAPRRLYAGADALALDLVAARHTGLRVPRKSAMLRTACYWFGDPTERTEVIGVDEPIAGWRDPYCNEWSTLLSFLSYPVYELGSGRGALFVPEMDVEAFPPIGGESRSLRLSRNALRALIGLRH